MTIDVDDLYTGTLIAANGVVAGVLYLAGSLLFALILGALGIVVLLGAILAGRHSGRVTSHTATPERRS